jgi:hypothetical protein
MFSFMFLFYLYSVSCFKPNDYDTLTSNMFSLSKTESRLGEAYKMTLLGVLDDFDMNFVNNTLGKFINE